MPCASCSLSDTTAIPSSCGRQPRREPKLYGRLRKLPGYGEEKAQIFVALLAKRFGVRPRGWKAAAGVFADAVADHRRLSRPGVAGQGSRVEADPA